MASSYEGGADLSLLAAKDVEDVDADAASRKVSGACGH
jgi:hypothetical protein